MAMGVPMNATGPSGPPPAKPVITPASLIPVTKVDWINPHARIFVDAKDANGKTVNWEIELGPPAILMRNGWARSAVKIGETVTVSGSLAKDGSNLANASSVTLASGKKVFAGSSGDAPTQ